MMLKVVLILLGFMHCILANSDLFFYLERSKCFFEELPNDTILLVEYKNPSFKTKRNILIKIYDPNDNEVLNTKAERYGKNAYLSTQVGEHKICIESPDFDTYADDSKSSKFHIKLELKGKGDDNIIDHSFDSSLTNIARKKHISELEEELKSLEAKIDLILKDLTLAKEQGEHFTEQSNLINSRIMIFSMLQTALLLISGFFQITHLQSFFKEKKLV